MADENEQQGGVADGGERGVRESSSARPIEISDELFERATNGSSEGLALLERFVVTHSPPWLPSEKIAAMVATRGTVARSIFDLGRTWELRRLSTQLAKVQQARRATGVV